MMQSGKETCYPNDVGNSSCFCVLGRQRCRIDPQADVERASLLESGLLDSKLSNRTAVASYRTPKQPQRKCLISVLSLIMRTGLNYNSAMVAGTMCGARHDEPRSET